MNSNGTRPRLASKKSRLSAIARAKLRNKELSVSSSVRKKRHVVKVAVRPKRERQSVRKRPN